MDNKKTVNVDLKQYGMIFMLIVIYLIFAALTKGATLAPANINNLVMQNGYVVILATGMLLCCLTGNVDLGVGSLVALTGAVCGIAMVDHGMSMWVALFRCLSGCAAFLRNIGFLADVERSYIYSASGTDKGSLRFQFHLYWIRFPAYR